MVALSGQSVEIKFTGLRRGEKLYEELHYDVEQLELTPVNKIRAVKQVDQQPKQLDQLIVEGQGLALRFQQDAVIHHLMQLVPEFNASGLSVVNNRDRLEQET